MDGGVEFVTVEIGGRAYRVAAYASLHHPVLTSGAGGEGDETGKMIWAGSYALCSYLLHAIAHRLQRHVLIELGAGAGLVTAVAAGVGKHVISTDGAEDAVHLCQRTVAACHVSNASVYRLTWSDDPSPEIQTAIHTALRAHTGAGVTIIAAEIVYPSTSAASLDDLFTLVTRLQAHAGDQASEFIMSYVQRAPKTTRLMLQTAWDHGFEWEVIPWEAFTSIAPLLGAQIIVFRACGMHTIDMPTLLSSTFPELEAQCHAVDVAVAEAAEEAATFVLPFVE